MRRHDQLIPLTHDHHHALARARAMRVEAEKGDQAGLVDETRRFLEFFDAETVEHFRDEEEAVFPRFVEASGGVPEVLLETLKQHVEIHAHVNRLRDELAGTGVTRGSARAAAAKLEAHVRLEEKELFPLIERTMSDEQLDRLSLRPRRRSSE